MPRQNFLTRESFVDATEKKTREMLLTVPQHLPYIQLQSENIQRQSLHFTYEQKAGALPFVMDVTILPLNDQYTRVSFHASYVNGQSFFEDPGMSLALHDFESALHAAIKEELHLYCRVQSREKTAGRLRVFLENALPFFWKKGLS